MPGQDPHSLLLKQSTSLLLLKRSHEPPRQGLLTGHQDPLIWEFLSHCLCLIGLDRNKNVNKEGSSQNPHGSNQ